MRLFLLFFCLSQLVLYQTFASENIKEFGWYDMMKVDLSAPTDTQLQRLEDPVKVVGFIVPFVDDGVFENIKEFYLVPDPMMCVHVPPPPSNQFLHVKMNKPIPLNSDFEGVWIYGNITTINANAEYGDPGYVLEGFHHEECDDYPYDEFLVDDLDELLESLISSENETH